MSQTQQESHNHLEGTVTAILFRNEENGYTVLRLDTPNRGEVTVVGCMPGVAPGETLELEGSWGRHASYGEQFKAEAIYRRMPVGENAIYEYLASGAVKGIRMGLARQIVDKFGAQALEIIENAPEELAQIRGVSLKPPHHQRGLPGPDGHAEPGGISHSAPAAPGCRHAPLPAVWGSGSGDGAE